jgi:hypothetical protein
MLSCQANLGQKPMSFHFSLDTHATEPKPRQPFSVLRKIHQYWVPEADHDLKLAHEVV